MNRKTRIAEKDEAREPYVIVHGAHVTVGVPAPLRREFRASHEVKDEKPSASSNRQPVSVDSGA